jgi:uncharacterized protein YhbP (UPF0306 family)
MSTQGKEMKLSLCGNIIALAIKDFLQRSFQINWLVLQCRSFWSASKYYDGSVQASNLMTYLKDIFA